VVLGLNVLVSKPPGPYAWKVSSPLLGG